MRITKRSGLLIGITYLLVILGTQLYAQPRIEWLTGTEHNFGTVYKGQTVGCTFAIKNSGTDTLRITDVIPSCGCTAALLSQSNVPPDSSAELMVHFSSGLFVGPTHKAIAIISNDPEHRESRLDIVSNVVQVLGFEPANIQFDVQGDSLKVYKKSIEVRNLTDRDIRVLSLSPKFDGLEVKLSNKTLKAGGSVTLYGSIKAKGFGFEGYAGGEVILTTDFQPQPEQSIHVTVASKN